MRLGLDPGGPEALETYERSRRFDTLAMGAATDGLNGCSRPTPSRSASPATSASAS